jgi:serine/threonine protein kinase
MVMRRLVALKVIAARATGSSEDAIPGRRETPWPRASVTPVPPSGSVEFDDPTIVERFNREVQLAAQLHHPNIVTAFDAAESDGVLFLVMEFVAGKDLGHHVAEHGPLPVPLACEYIRQTALGLQYAHERGLVHRDVKPSNLLITKAGVVKLLDLGLARMTGTPLEEYEPVGSATHISGLAGTPDYMAPELAHDSQTANARSDLYSLGCTFYYLLTGHVPYPGGGWTEKLLRHQLDPAPAVCVLRADVPAEVSAVANRLMAKDPSQRHAHGGEVAEELQQWLLAHQTAQGLPPAPWPHVAVHTPSPSDSLIWTTPKSTPTVDPDSVLETRPVSAAPTPLSRPRRLPWPLAMATAMAMGLVVAWLVHGPRVRSASVPELRATRTAADVDGESEPRERDVPDLVRPTPAIFVVEGITEDFHCLAAAVAAAPTNGTVMIHGNGSIATRPIDLRGKALTLRAAKGCRPRLCLVRAAGDAPWQPLLTADRPLALEGLELSHSPSAVNSTESTVTHLVCCEGSSLSMTQCRLHAPSGTAVVLCRNCCTVQIRDCQFTATALAVCVEMSEGRDVSLELSGTTIDVLSASGAALSLWTREGHEKSAVSATLNGNTIRAGRIFACRHLPSRMTLKSVRNEFAFREALLSYTDLPTRDAWRPVTSWEGQDNRYSGPMAWVMIDGAPAKVGGLEAWQGLWGPAETGARQASAPAYSAPQN